MRRRHSESLFITTLCYLPITLEDDIRIQSETLVTSPSLTPHIFTNKCHSLPFALAVNEMYNVHVFDSHVFNTKFLVNFVNGYLPYFVTFSIIRDTQYLCLAVTYYAVDCMLYILSRVGGGGG
jgi:hypothetical protein